MKCPCQNWEIIDAFYSMSEFDRFFGWIKKQVRLGFAEEVVVEKPYGGSPWEFWFACGFCKKKWRLVTPDPPFRGLFEPVEEP